MMKTFGIGLLLMGLLAAGVDGFRTRERVRMSPGTTAGQNDVHTAEVGGACGLCIPR